MKTIIGTMCIGLERVARAAGRAERAVTLVGTSTHLEIHKTNGSTFAMAKIPVTDGVEFKTVVDGNRLRDVLKSVDQAWPLTIKVEEKGFRLLFGKAKIKIPEITAEPMLLSHTEWAQQGVAFEVLGNEIKASLKQTVVACADEKETRHYLCGVYFTRDKETNKLLLVASNGFFLTVSETNVSLQSTWEDTIVPSRVVEALVGSLGDNEKVQVAFSNEQGKPNGINFKSESFEVVCPTILGKFPNWKVLIPNESKRSRIELNTQEFADTAKRIGEFSKHFGGFTSIMLKTENSVLIVSDSSNPGSEDSFDTVEPVGDGVCADWQASFNHQFIVGALSAASDAKVEAFYSPAVPGSEVDMRNQTLLLKGQGWKTVIQPMRT